MNPTDENNWTVIAKRSKKGKMSLDPKKKLPTSKEPQPSITTEEMAIEPDLMGHLAGHMGNNLKRLKEIYGVNISLPPRGGSRFTINGRTEMVFAARKEIEETILRQTSFFVGKDYIHLLVIGREGRNIQALEDVFSVRINIHKEKEPKEEIVITGTRCEEAKKAIEANLSIKTRFFLEKDHILLVLGREGKNIKTLEDALAVKIDINKENGEVVITGRKCKEAKNAIEESLLHINSFFIEMDYVHLVKGPEGENIHGLEDKLKVNITIKKEDGKVLVSGKEWKAAKKAIESMIERLKIDYPYQKKFAVPSNLIGSVCGKNGSNRKRIESTHKVHVFISSALGLSKDSQMVIVKGSVASNVSDAKKDILENLPWTTRFDVDDSFVEIIFGPGEETVRLLEIMEHNVLICLKDGKAYISGMEDRTEAAKDAIILIMSKFKKNDGDATSP